MREKVEKIICDHCKKWIDKEKDFVSVCGTENYSKVVSKDITLRIEDTDFCNLTCFFAYVREHFSQGGVPE